VDTALRMYAADDPRVAQLRAERGIVRLKRKKYGDAEKDLVEAYQAEVTGFGADHPSTRSTASWMAKLYDQMGQTAQAEKYRKLAGE